MSFCRSLAGSQAVRYARERGKEFYANPLTATELPSCPKSNGDWNESREIRVLKDQTWNDVVVERLVG